MACMHHALILMFERIHEIEKKWQRRWAESKLFEADANPRRKKIFTSNVIPYVNGDAHLGHAFTYTRVDAWARFKRMQGYNVCLAQGFHATGEPILGTVERLKQGDPTQLETFKTYGATDDDIRTFEQLGAEGVARFWTERIIETCSSMGFSVDWRRKFITAIEPSFNRFIEWQYNTLRKLGYVCQGTHPVIWCPHCQSPTGDHDRLQGEGESPIEYTLLKFKLVDALSAEHRAPIYLVAATLRPETVNGVTNIWINPDAEYAITMVGNELWLVATQAVPKLQDQLPDVRDIGHVPAGQLLGKRTIEPIRGRAVPILPAHFVEAESATGVVMSVPAHAPYDWIAVKELLDRPEELERFGVKADELTPITIASTPELPDPPGVKVCEKLGIKSQKERDKLDEATSLVYKREFHMGVLNAQCGEWAGKKISEIKEPLVRAFVERGIAASMWEPTGTVVCRCRTRNHVKILENQWFLKFSDEKWKERVKRALAQMQIIPDEARANFEATITWLKDKACARRSGLGTRLPWDPEWIVETLSDSTIYMAYYTIAHIISEEKIKAESLTDAVFDFVFLGKGDAKAVARSSGLPLRTLKRMRAEFDYWYPLDMRNSGKDLVQNHLTFFLFHHVAIFDEKKWPKAISVNGYVNVEGEKMSKSKGNFIPLRNLIEKFGADLTRINIASSAEGIDDADWRESAISSFKGRLQFLDELVRDLGKARGKKVGLPESALLSQMQKSIQITTAAYDELRFRSGVQACLFDATNAIKWYLKRVGGIKNASKKVLKDAATAAVLLLSPLTPHICEELWSMLGRKGFISMAPWPEANEKLVDKEAEAAEDLIKKTLADVDAVKKLVAKKGMAAKKVTLFVAQTKLFPVPKQKDAQLKTLADAKDFLARELGCAVEVVDADASKHEKAAKARPDKLGIFLE